MLAQEQGFLPNLTPLYNALGYLCGCFMGLGFVRLWRSLHGWAQWLSRPGIRPVSSKLLFAWTLNDNCLLVSLGDSFPTKTDLWAV